MFECYTPQLLIAIFAPESAVDFSRGVPLLAGRLLIIGQDLPDHGLKDARHRGERVSYPFFYPRRNNVGIF